MIGTAASNALPTFMQLFEGRAIKVVR